MSTQGAASGGAFDLFATTWAAARLACLAGFSSRPWQPTKKLVGIGNREQLLTALAILDPMGDRGQASEVRSGRFFWRDDQEEHPHGRAIERFERYRLAADSDRQHHTPQAGQPTVRDCDAVANSGRAEGLSLRQALDQELSIVDDTLAGNQICEGLKNTVPFGARKIRIDQGRLGQLREIEHRQSRCALVAVVEKAPGYSSGAMSPKWPSRRRYRTLTAWLDASRNTMNSFLASSSASAASSTLIGLIAR